MKSASVLFALCSLVVPLSSAHAVGMNVTAAMSAIVTDGPGATKVIRDSDGINSAGSNVSPIQSFSANLDEAGVIGSAYASANLYSGEFTANAAINSPFFDLGSMSSGSAKAQQYFRVIGSGSVDIYFDLFGNWDILNPGESVPKFIIGAYLQFGDQVERYIQVQTPNIVDPYGSIFRRLSLTKTVNDGSGYNLTSSISTYLKIALGSASLFGQLTIVPSDGVALSTQPIPVSSSAWFLIASFFSFLVISSPAIRIARPNLVRKRIRCDLPA